MSQLIACRNSHGVLLASDGQAPVFELNGEVHQTEVNRMVKLSPYSVILAGGAADGVEMCDTLKRFISDEGTEDVQDIYGAALPFLATEFERVMRRKCEVIPVDPVHQVHFILAGVTFQDPQQPFRLYLIWTKQKQPRLDGDEIGVAFSIPRLMGLEYRLERSCHGNCPLADMLPELKSSMEEQSKENPEIGPPFSYAMVTKDGVQEAD